MLNIQDATVYPPIASPSPFLSLCPATELVSRFEIYIITRKHSGVLQSVSEREKSVLQIILTTEAYPFCVLDLDGTGNHIGEPVNPGDS